MNSEKMGGRGEQVNESYDAWANMAKEVKSLPWAEVEKQIQEIPWRWDNVGKHIQGERYGLSPEEYTEYKNDVIERAVKEHNIRQQNEDAREAYREIKKMYYDGGLTMPEEVYDKRKAILEKLGSLDSQKNNIECEIDVLRQELDKLPQH